jgi:hypothetical protein
MSTTLESGRRIYWHRELPPLDARFMAEYVVEADSKRVTVAFVHGDETWNVCYADLMATAAARLTQEIDRLGGDGAHVLSETISPKHDYTTGESWLHARLTYMLFRRPATGA